MGHAFGMHRMNKRKVVHLACHVGKERGHVLSAFAVLLEIPKGFHQASFARFAKGACSYPDKVEVLAVLCDQFGFVVEGIDVTDRTGAMVQGLFAHGSAPMQPHRRSDPGVKPPATERNQ